MPRIRELAVALVAAAAVALTGCAPAPPSLSRAEIVAEISCAGIDPLGEDAGGAGRVPEDFEPVAAVRCVPFHTVEDDEGVWSVVLRERLEGDLTAVLDAQAAADDPRWLGACAAIATIAPQVWLTDAAGRGIRLRYPVDGCGQPKIDLIGEALAGLAVVQSDEEQRTLVEPRAAIDAGCAPTWSARPLQLAPAEGLEGLDGPDDDVLPEPAPSPDGVRTVPWTPPGVPAPGEVDALRLCAYSTEPTAAPRQTPSPGATAWATIEAEDTAWFTGGRELDAAETRAVLETVASAQPLSERCDDVPGSLVVLSAGNGTTPITVERDGCRRLILDFVATFAAPQALVDLLAG